MEGKLVVASLGVNCLVTTPKEPYLKEILLILSKHDLHPRVGAVSTEIEGSMEQVFRAVNECINALYSMGITKAEIDLHISCNREKSLTIASRIKDLNQHD